MRRRIRAWRRRQRSRLIFVAVPVAHGTGIVASGLVQRRALRMIEVQR